MKFYFYFLILCLSNVVLAQTGPGGVGSSVNNNFWIDANELQLLNNESVNQFVDVSGNNNSFIQLNSTKQPVYKTNVVNGMPVVRFDGANDNMQTSAIPALVSSNVTWFIVYKQNVQKTCGILGSSFSSESKKWRSYALSNGAFKSVHFSPSIVHTGYNDNFSSFNFSSSHITPTSLKIYKEGVLKQTKNSTYTTPVGHQFSVIGSFASQTHFLNGDIAEAFVFNSTLTNLERVIVENYLGAKYNKAIPQDYYSHQGNHKFGVIGIGNDGVTTHTASTGNGVLTLQSPTALSSNEYMFIGHDGTDLSTIVNGDMPVAVSTHSRLARTWRMDETGDLGNVTLRFDVSGAAGFAENLTYNLLVDSDANGNFSNATVVAGVYTAGVMVFTLDLPSGAAFTLSGVPTVPVAIHSITTGSWNTLSTWDCACIPSITDTVFIEPTHIVDVDVDGFVYNLNVNSGGTLEMSQDFTLSIKGDFNAVGSLNLTNGELEFMGNTAQNINGSGSSHNLNRVLLNNTSVSNITLTNGEFVMNDILDPLNGSLVIDNAGGGNLVINSTSSVTSGRIGVMSASSSITGNVSVRRFLPAGVAGERDISSPVIGANLSEWDASISISGEGFPDGCAYGSNGCYYSCKKYVGGDFTGSYIDVTNPNEPLTNGMGFEIFIGDNLNTFSGATLTSTGTIRDYQDHVLNYPTVKSGWNIVGNPYASPILFSQMNTDHMGNYFYVYDPASGGYQWYDGSANSSSIPELANGALAIGQGFWIYAGGVPDLIFSQSIKSSNNATFIRNARPIENLLLTLSEDGTTYKNSISIAFNENASDAYDILDIEHLMMENQKSAGLLISSNDKKLAKNYLTSDGRDKRQTLVTRILNSGYYEITATNLEGVSGYNSVQLIDNLTGEIIDLKKYSTYTFYAEEGESQRFQLILSNEIIQNNGVSIFEAETEDSELTITQMGNAINVQSDESLEGLTEVSVVNLLGQDVVYNESVNIISGSNMIILPSDLSGMYLVIVKSKNGVETKKIML